MLKRALIAISVLLNISFLPFLFMSFNNVGVKCSIEADCEASKYLLKTYPSNRTNEISTEDILAILSRDEIYFSRSSMFLSFDESGDDGNCVWLEKTIHKIIFGRTYLISKVCYEKNHERVVSAQIKDVYL